MVYKENNPGFISFEKEGDEVEGVLINIQNDVGANKSMLYTIETGAEAKSIWGSTILDQRMLGIKVGDKIKIIYKGLGEKKGGKNAPKIFQVLVDKD